MKKGAPIEPLLTEGGGRSRWRGVGLEGSAAPQCGFTLGALGNQRRRPAGLCGGRGPCPSECGTPGEGPARSLYAPIDDVKEFPKYEKLWKEIFQIR